MDIETRLDQVAGFLQTGKPEKALSVLRSIQKQFPNHAETAHLLGVTYFQQGKLQRAIDELQKATKLDPHQAVQWNNLALVYVAQNQLENARQALEQALLISPQNVDSLFGRGNVFRAQGLFDQAIADYEAALKLDPYSLDTLNNLGCALMSHQKTERAQTVFEQALQINPKFVRARNNLGLLYEALGQWAEAESAYRLAVSHAPDYLEARVNLGNVLMRNHEYAQAAEHYARAQKLNAHQPFIAGNLAYVRSMQCDWQQYKQTWSRIEGRIRQGEMPCSPIQLLNGSDDPELSKRLSQMYAKDMVKQPDLPPLSEVQQSLSSEFPKDDQKIRIGYFSSDFRDHPVATLIAGVLEDHDTQRFEVLGYALDAQNTSEMRSRIGRACQRFFEVGAMSVTDLVEFVRGHDLDIAIDLNGYTEGGRAAIFKARVAPLQISYLGYPGTSGDHFIDYTIADSFVIPAQMRTSWTEHVIYMPDSFQPNDDSRQVNADGLSRAQFGLPQEAVVFCCFNKLYKLTPMVFESWMRILKRVPNSVLWLYSEDPVAQDNLKRQAQKQGVDANRLVFAGRTEQYEQHLARYQLADLFLDTFPYGAHTTGSDALWAGLPVLTRTGRSFASCVGESMVQALGMPELVTRDAKQFEERAVLLAQESGGFDRLKAQLAQAKAQAPLFQTAAYTRHLESGYTQIVTRHRNGQALCDIRLNTDGISEN
ncbi:tetratricopeptide repeat protein [Orrella sp. 11846]|uniref:O-linked N-acetylglucosamine transferase, SPINDLY family protein n=1 Tax=Orrella sp. 11846 TaxID=3409913 RepID=UPI003B5C9236